MRPNPLLHRTTVHLGPRPLRDARAIHRAIEHHTHPHRTLWAHPNPRTLILRSHTAHGWHTIPGATHTHTRQEHTHYQEDTPIRWALIANPTRADRSSITLDPDGTPHGRGRHVGITDPGHATAWARRRLADALHLDTIHAEQLPPARGAHGLALTRWAYTGTGTVTGTETLAQLLAGGVGRGKAFGCGLLLVQETP